MKIIKFLVLILLAIGMCTGCESLKRSMKDWDSEMEGLNRIVNVYSYDGKLIATYEGKLDLQMNEKKQ